jgi:hypothetical protein
MAYPLLMAARITPIKAPQTKRELPKTGARSRLPRISSAITTAPVMNAVAKSHRRAEAVPDGAVMRQPIQEKIGGRW